MTLPPLTADQAILMPLAGTDGELHSTIAGWEPSSYLSSMAPFDLIG
ncbi:MAG TPA: hypothetical protein VLE03_02880 [Nitrospiraceae bacterium]|nr:hypothetical protein [Nitrospiraceae bacterium]